MRNLINQARALAEATKDDPELHRATKRAQAAIQRLHLIIEYRGDGEPHGKTTNSKNIDTDDSRIGAN